MQEIRVVETSLDEDLKDFSVFLWQQGIAHRITEEAGLQVVFAGSQAHAGQITQAYEQLRSGQLKLERVAVKGDAPAPENYILAGIGKAPVTTVFLLLSILGYLLVNFDRNFSWVQYLTFFEFQSAGRNIIFSYPRGEYWRMLTPIFLHFSVMHIVFNMLWLWDLGRRVEVIQGRSRIFGLIMVVGLGSNIIQALFAQASIFGGMSGVIYGLLGYSWIWSYFVPEHSLDIPKAVIIFMLAWLLLCMFGFAALLGAGAVANAAHLGGLLIGMLMGFGASMIHKMSRSNTQS